jgi:hypothetical protein
MSFQISSSKGRVTYDNPDISISTRTIGECVEKIWEAEEDVDIGQYIQTIRQMVQSVYEMSGGDKSFLNQYIKVMNIEQNFTKEWVASIPQL